MQILLQTYELERHITIFLEANIILTLPLQCHSREKDGWVMVLIPPTWHDVCQM